MTYFPVQSPYNLFSDTDGEPLESGYIYIGEANQNPITNPINVYWDSTGLYPAAQPVRTIGGYPDRNGSPAKIYVNAGAFEDYSILINDKHGRLVFYAQSARFDDIASGNTVNLIDDLRSISGYGQPIFVRGHTTIGDGGQGIFEWFDGAAPGTYIDDNGKTIVPTGGDGSGAWIRQYKGIISANDYGAIGDDSTNDYMAFYNAINNNDVVAAKAGYVYSLESMLIIPGNKTLIIEAGAWIKRKSTAISTDPVLWLYGNYATVRGNGSYSIISSEKDAPYGVVRIGHENLTTSHGNVLYCRMNNLRIIGQQAYGKTSGTADQGIAFYNPQFTSLASYFHFIDNIQVQNTNTAIGLHGWSNANMINNIQLYQVANDAGDDYRKAIFMNGCQENNIHNVFHHFSPDAWTIYVDILDNTGNGGSTHTPAYNDVSGIISEQGGSNQPRCLYINAIGNNNTFRVKANTGFSNILPATFGLQNQILDDENTIGGTLTNESITTDEINYLGTDPIYSPVGFVNGSYDNGISCSLSKRNSSTGAASLSFNLINRNGGASYYHGYIKINVSSDIFGASNSDAAWFFYGASTISASYPTGLFLKDSGGDIATYTITLVAGVLSITTTKDNIVATVEYSNPVGSVSIT